MKTTHLRTRREGETGGERCLSRKVEILDDGSARERDEKGEQSGTLIMRVSHERGAESTSNPLTEGDRKSCVIYRVMPPI